MRNLNEKTYNEVLTEASDFFQNQGMSIIGEGYKEIASNPALFESYVDQLTEGCSADSAVEMAQLMANTNAGILRESSMTGIQPIASLSMPVIRKLWPKFALKAAVTTEVAKTPRFVVPYTAPYMFRGDEKVYIPGGLKLNVFAGESSDALSKTYVKPTTATGVADGVATVAAGAALVLTFDTAIADTPSTVKKQPCDELVIKSAVYDDGTDTAAGTFAEGNVKPIKIGKKLSVYGSQVYAFDGGQLMVQFDGAACTATIVAIGKAVKVEVVAGVSTEFNEDAWSVGFDIKRQDIDIPTGQHINAPLPIEALNDMLALYQIDGTKETVDLMTNIFAQKLDIEVLQFLQQSFLDRPSNEAFPAPEYGVADDFKFIFDCKPAAGYAHEPKAWREELKPLIDHLAQRIKNETYLQSGVFNIVANPLDAQILANIDWQYRGGQGGNVDGVDADYSVGTYVGANAYKVIASTNVPAGTMFVVFLPSSEKQMTYKYYPYTFSTEMGYTDPNRSRVPSIMMTKRHQFFEFMPAIGLIEIKNNDGKGYFAQYTEWKEHA